MLGKHQWLDVHTPPNVQNTAKMKNSLLSIRTMREAAYAQRCAMFGGGGGLIEYSISILDYLTDKQDQNYLNEAHQRDG